LRLGRVATALLAVGMAFQLSNSPTPAQAQTARDTLTLGRRAYERADFAAATSLLPVGLAAGGSRGDTLWVAGVHMLTDALLEQGKDSAAQLWARWATRLTGGFSIDSTVYPPRVTRVLGAARAAVGPPNPADTLINDAWDEDASSAEGRGVIRIQRGGQGVLAVVDGLGTMLPGESRTVAPGTYQIRMTADGFAPLAISREVLPGYATIITPRLVRPGAVAAGASAAAPRPGSAPASAAPVIRGTTIAAAGSNTCAVLETGAAVCWGSNNAGQLGGGIADSTRRTPVTVGGEPLYAAVSVGGTHSCALTREGRAWCWGMGTSGELGNGQTASGGTPVAVSGGQAFVQITTGAYHSCALSAAGAVFCWGANRDGALGNRTSNSSPVPVSVAAPANVSFTALTSGLRHTCALASNGAAYCWGANASGQLGIGSSSDANAPALVASGVPFKAIAAGASHTCALTPAGSAWCWGANVNGQLGNGGNADNSRPTAVSGSLSLSALAAGETHTCGLTDDGAAYCWGAGRAGQLGNGQSADVPRPALVVGGHIFRAMALGALHTCATADDRTTWCWGSNNDGQVGGLAARNTATPIPFVVRPPIRTTAAGAPAALRESFADGNWTAGPAWSVDSASDLRLAIADSALDVTRNNSRGQVAAAGLTIPVHIPVTRTTQVQFDVMVRQGGMTCGLNCANYPAVVRLRVKNSDLTESEVWYAFGDRGAQSHSFGGVVIVARGDLTAGTWLRAQRFTVRDALPRADTILQVSLGGIGAVFGARFDNLLLPLPVATALNVTPDSIRLTAAVPPTRLRAVVRDASGAEIPEARVTWQSSDTLIARVDSIGTVRPVANGRAVIRAQSGALVDSSRVTVRLAPARRARRP